MVIERPFKMSEAEAKQIMPGDIVFLGQCSRPDGPMDKPYPLTVGRAYEVIGLYSHDGKNGFVIENDDGARKSLRTDWFDVYTHDSIDFHHE